MSRPHRRNLAWSGADQAAASLITLVVSLVALRTSEHRAAFEFSVSLVVLAIAMGGSRSLTAEVTAVSDHSETARPRALVAGVGTAALVASGAAFGLYWGFGFRTPTGVASALLIVAACASDSVRTHHLACRAPRAAAIASTVPLVVVLLTLPVAAVNHSAVPLIVAWATGSALLAGVTAVRNLKPARQAPPLGGGKVGLGFLYEFVVTTGASQGSILLATPMAGPGLAIAGRGGATAFGPYFAAFQAVALLAVPALRDRATKEGRKSARAVAEAARVSAGLLALLAGWSCVAYGAVYWGGEAIFGEAATSVSTVFWPYLAGLCGSAFVAGPFLAMRANALRRQSMILRTWAGISQVLLTVLGALAGGVPGFFIGSGAAGVISGALGFVILRAESRPRKLEAFACREDG
jgi:hypothetical protein